MQALPSSAATCQNQLLVLQIGLCLFLYVFPVFELLSVLFCSVLLCLGPTPAGGAAYGRPLAPTLALRRGKGSAAACSDTDEAAWAREPGTAQTTRVSMVFDSL